MARYKSEESPTKAAKRPVESGVYTTQGYELQSVLKSAAEKMGLDLDKADLGRTREILSRGTSVSYIIKQMRER